MVLKGSAVFIILVLVSGLASFSQIHFVSAQLSDTDGDGVPDNLDNCKNVYNPFQEDTDGDGIGDACTTGDEDGDGIPNNEDNCPFVVNPGQEDSDDDGVGDACQIVDNDGDNVDDSIDNCPNAFNPGQTDTDGDGIGDACTTGDEDGDGIPNETDNCDQKPNPLQEDADLDTIGDVCEDLDGDGNPNNDDTDGDGIPNYLDNNDDNDSFLTTYEDDGDGDFNNDDSDSDGIPDYLDATFNPSTDTDGDGVNDLSDNCPKNINTGQADADGDGIGDTCDLFPLDPNNDAEGDGVGANEDNCPFVINPGQEDSDGDGEGDVCEGRPKVSINDTAISDLNLVEGNTGPTNFYFAVELSHQAPFPISVQFSTVDGSAIAGEDYILNSGFVNFDTGDFVQQITVQVNGDRLTEPDESFSVFLSNAIGADIVDATGNAIIINDDSSPVADDQSITTAEDTPFAINLTATDNDLDALSFMVNIQPSHGILSGTAPNLTYTPQPNFNGEDFFTFKASDGANNSNEATVNVIVTPVNDAPVASDDVILTQEDIPIEILALNLVSNDIDADMDALSLTEVSNPRGGTVSLDLTGTITFTPFQDFNGDASFEYVVSDGSEFGIGLVQVTVEPVNDTPTLETQLSISMLEDNTFQGTMITSDVDGDALTITAPTQGAKGVVLILDNSAYRYTPNTNSNGADQFTLRVSDGNSFFDVFVTVDITPVNDPPTADAGADQSIIEDTLVKLTGFGSDVDGDALTFTWTQTAGTTVILSDASATNPTFIAPLVDPSGQTLEFTLTVTDGNGGTATDTTTIRVNNIESVPPEAYNQFDPITKDVLVFGIDDRDGNLGPIPPTSVIPTKWFDENRGDRTNTAELRIYVIKDAAENKLTLKELVKIKGKEIKVKVVSIQYNNNPEITPSKNQKSFEWSVTKDGSIKELEQMMKVGKGHSEQKVKAKFDAQKNQTIIQSEKPKLKETLPGLVLLKMNTVNGNLVITH
jgi:hypothetical protein